MAAASRAARKMVFYTFEDRMLNDAPEIVEHYKNKSVGAVVTDIIAYCENYELVKGRISDIFSYILSLK